MYTTRLNIIIDINIVIYSRVTLYDAFHITYTRTLHITLLYKFLPGGNQVDGLPPDCNSPESSILNFLSPPTMWGRGYANSIFSKIQRNMTLYVTDHPS